MSQFSAADYLVQILGALVKNPRDLRVETQNDEMGVLLIVTCHPEDMGIIIGKQGDTAKAVRHLIRNVGALNQKRVSVRFNEPKHV